MNDFSHLDKSGNVRMVDVTDKIDTSRIARAEGKIFMKSETISALPGKNDLAKPLVILKSSRPINLHAPTATAALFT